MVGKLVCFFAMLVVVVISFSACVEYPLSPRDTPIYLKNNSSQPLRYHHSASVASSYLDTSIQQNILDYVFDHVDNPKYLESEDSVIIVELSKQTLQSRKPGAFYGKYQIFNYDTIQFYNLSKQQVMDTHKGVTIFVIDQIYSGWEAINFTIVYPKEDD